MGRWPELRGERRETGRGYSPLGQELLDARDVRVRPVAVRPAWREAGRVALVVDRFVLALDPAIGEPFLDRFFVTDARLAGGLLVIDQPDFPGVGVMLGEPASPLEAITDGERLADVHSGLEWRQLTRPGERHPKHRRQVERGDPRRVDRLFAGFVDHGQDGAATEIPQGADDEDRGRLHVVADDASSLPDGQRAFELLATWHAGRVKIGI